MRLMAVSDLHGILEGLDPRGADIVLVAGDFAPMKGWGTWQVNDQVKWINKKFARWCSAHPETEFVVCPGNHDLFAARDDVPTRPEWPENTHFIVDSVIEVKGLKLGASPWVPPINGRWAFEADSETELMRRFAWIPVGLDILVTHTPPRIEGSDIDVSLEWNSPHFGSVALEEAIRRTKPRYHFCGHIHSGNHAPVKIVHGDGGVTISQNVSRVNEHYEIAYEPAYVEI